MFAKLSDINEQANKIRYENIAAGKKVSQSMYIVFISITDKINAPIDNIKNASNKRMKYLLSPSENFFDMRRDA